MERRFVCVLKIEKQILMNGNGNGGTVDECLFVPAVQYPLFAKVKNKSDNLLFDLW